MVCWQIEFALAGTVLAKFALLNENYVLPTSNANITYYICQNIVLIKNKYTKEWNNNFLERSHTGTVVANTVVAGIVMEKVILLDGNYLLPTFNTTIFANAT